MHIFDQQRRTSLGSGSLGAELTALLHPAAASVSEAAAYYIVHNSHIPASTQLYRDILTHNTGSFLGMNLQCSPIQAGGGNVTTKDS